jgi:hypothetical protein
VRGKRWIQRARARRDAREDRQFRAATERIGKGTEGQVAAAERALGQSNVHLDDQVRAAERALKKVEDRIEAQLDE